MTSRVAMLLNSYSVKSGIAVTNPADGCCLMSVRGYDIVEIGEVIERADVARIPWRGLTAQERSVLLRRWHRQVLDNIDELAEIITLESGKPFVEARSEVNYGASFIEWFAEEGKRAYGEVIPSFSPDSRILTLRQPIGTCAAITPWNFPMAMITRKVAPALAAGCSIVVKPAEATPLTALALEQLANRAGIAAYCYTRDIGRAWRVMEHLEFGMVAVNEGVLSTEVAPFGGIKQSGFGREGSSHGLMEYMEIKYGLMGGLGR